MLLPNTAHTSRTWRIHELTSDFQLEDVWALPTPGGPDDFPSLVSLMSAADPSTESSGAARMLWTIRWKVGALLGWDRPESGVGSRVATLRDRLPADLRNTPTPEFGSLPFTSVYLLDDEWAAEIANQTVHGVLHVGWVQGEEGGYRGQMAVYAKPNGLLGTAYMAAIRPFRHQLVYPGMLRQISASWRNRGRPMTAAQASRVGVPPAARALSTLPHVDYEDGFLLETDLAESRTAEQWARAIIEDTPTATRKALRRGWFALGLKLGPTPSDRSVLGWEIRRSTPDSLLLGASSWIGMPAELVVMRGRGTVLLVTFVQQQNPITRAIWTLTTPSHRRIVPRLLKRAARSQHR